MLRSDVIFLLRVFPEVVDLDFPSGRAVIDNAFPIVFEDGLPSVFLMKFPVEPFMLLLLACPRQSREI